VEIPEQVVQVNDEIFVKVIDIDLERRRISLSLKQANESFGPDPASVDFDPTLYGMAASYDDQGNYIYPEGFDPEANDWLEGYEKQREEWERQYAEAQTRFEQHQAQVIKSREADEQAAAEGAASGGNGGGGGNNPQPQPGGGNSGGGQTGGPGGSYSSESNEDSGALASDEALAALREKLAGGQS
jgi:small subunit ribosomal protein S1